jgi:hypothetical protein
VALHGACKPLVIGIVAEQQCVRLKRMRIASEEVARALLKRIRPTHDHFGFEAELAKDRSGGASLRLAFERCYRHRG